MCNIDKSHHPRKREATAAEQTEDKKNKTSAAPTPPTDIHKGEAAHWLRIQIGKDAKC